MRSSSGEATPPAPRNLIPRFRPTARLLVLDPGDRLLLFEFRAGDGSSFWLTPGGGIHRGESVEAAAVRELAEETGYLVTEAALGPAVATRAGLWRSAYSGRIVFGADTFFLVRVAGTAVSADGHEDHEREIIAGYRWWSAAELREAAEDIRPPGIANLVTSLLAGGPPSKPVRLPWRAWR
jgi:8-oxo-dGTP pyrophosphatase MutT (NUDIX family)